MTRPLLAALSSSPLRISFRVTYWRDCWTILQRALDLREPTPISASIGAGVDGASARTGLEETQHEAMLTRCGLSAATARCVLQHYTLPDFLGIPPHLRSASFGWIPDGALRCLSVVVDCNQDQAEQTTPQQLQPPQSQQLQQQPQRAQPPSSPPQAQPWNRPNISTQYHPTSPHPTRYDTIRYDTIRYDTTRYDTTTYDTRTYDTTR